MIEEYRKDLYNELTLLVAEPNQVPAFDFLEDKHSSITKTAQRLDTLIGELTKIFVRDLSDLSDKLHYHILLFFDTFEQTALTVVPWLLEHFLTVKDISPRIVLLFGGQKSIEESTTSADAKRWLTYKQYIHKIRLETFTEEETRIYLSEYNIIDPDRVKYIWRDSRGLPFYLGHYTFNPDAHDLTRRVVENTLSVIPIEETMKRRLALDAALFSGSFNQDDLSAFSYIPISERAFLYEWLIALPFIRSLNGGRYGYHELALEQFRRYHAQHTLEEDYYEVRRSLAQHYQHRLEQLEKDSDPDKFLSVTWLNLVNSVIIQLLYLPEESNHIKVIAYVVKAQRDTPISFPIRHALRNETQSYYDGRITASSRNCTQHLIVYLADELSTHNFINSVTYLINKVSRENILSLEISSELFYKRSISYFEQENHKLAIEDINKAIELQPNNEQLYLARGSIYEESLELEKAIVDYDHALELNPRLVQGYLERSSCYIELKIYDFALRDANIAVELAPYYIDARMTQSIAYLYLKKYRDAINSTDKALELDPKSFEAYYWRGEALLNLGLIPEAKENFFKSAELKRDKPATIFIIEWLDMGQEKPGKAVAARLMTASAYKKGTNKYAAFVCQGVAFSLHKKYKEALEEFERAIKTYPFLWGAHFWKGLILGMQGNYSKCIQAIETSIENGLPPILLLPLHWLEKEHNTFYHTYALPLIQRYHSIANTETQLITEEHTTLYLLPSPSENSLN